MNVEPMPEWEENLRSTFGNRRVHSFPSERNIVNLIQAVEKFTGEKYVPKEKRLKDKIQKILDLSGDEGEWDAKTMQRHLFFFHQKNIHLSSIGRVLKKLAHSGVLEQVGRGIYKKADK